MFAGHRSLSCFTAAFLFSLRRERAASMAFCTPARSFTSTGRNNRASSLRSQRCPEVDHVCTASPHPHLCYCPARAPHPAVRRGAATPTPAEPVAPAHPFDPEHPGDLFRASVTLEGSRNLARLKKQACRCWIPSTPMACRPAGAGRWRAARRPGAARLSPASGRRAAPAGGRTGAGEAVAGGGLAAAAGPGGRGRRAAGYGWGRQARPPRLMPPLSRTCEPPSRR